MSSATVLRRIATSLRKSSSNDSSPKYKLLHSQILTAIEKGEWAPGEKLPPETTFAQEIPLSLGTIQKALQMLADDGVVVRRHRDGTYVAGAVIIDEATIYRFLADDEKNLLPIYMFVLDVTRTDEKGPWSTFLKETSFVRITRRVSINVEFEAYNQVYLPAERFSTFLETPVHELHGVSLEKVLGERHNAPILRTVQRMQATTLPAQACQAIGMEDGTVGMSWDVLAYSYRDMPITYQRIYLPPNNRQLEVREYRH